MSKVLVNESSLVDIADAIREKNGSEDKYKPSEMGDAVRAIENGVGSGENQLLYATNINSLYDNAILPNGYELIFDLPNFGRITGGKLVGECHNSFSNAKGIKKICFKGNDKKALISLSYTFYFCDVEIIDFLEFLLKPQTMSNSFRSCTNLTTILGEFDLSECTGISVPFDYSSNLKEIRFKPNTIKLSIGFWSQSQLSDDTIKSVIDGLADLTGSTAQTLTLHGTVKAKLTETQLTTITSKNWTLA